MAHLHYQVPSSIFLSGCCMAQRRSLSGRSPFCQRKLSEESQIMEICFLESNNINHIKNTKHTNHDAVSKRVQGRVGVACCSSVDLFLLLPRVRSTLSPTDSSGPHDTGFYTLRAPLLVRLLLGAPFPAPSLSCFLS